MEAMITLRPNSITVLEIKRKATAFKELTGVYPEIFIQGIMVGKHGDLVFFTSQSVKIKSLFNSTFVADVDGKFERLKISRVDKLVFRSQ